MPAHQPARRCAHRPRKPWKLAVQSRLRRRVFALLARYWSPEQIAEALRQRHRFRPPRKPRPIQAFLSIEERPAEVADRMVPGHWEGDVLVRQANASALGTLVERTTPSRC